MKLNFYSVAWTSAFICFALAVAWLFAPQVLSAWGDINYSYPVGLIGRRGAALFFGIGVMFAMARNAEPSPARAALAYGFAVACLCLSALGLYEYLTSHVGAAILLAMAVEFILAAMLLMVAGKK